MTATNEVFPELSEKEIVQLVGDSATEMEVDKFEDSDVNPQCIELANKYVMEYTGTFSYLTGMKETFLQRGYLSGPQVRGVLNCILREYRRPAPSNTGEIVTQDGMYRTPDGEIFKVQFNRGEGDGRRLYAKKLVVVREPVREEGKVASVPAVIRFDYIAGAIRKLTPVMKMTLEDAITFGALYGTCLRCGRTLTREESIDRSMGPVCVRYFQ